jgi:homoserine acetyltransferase
MRPYHFPIIGFGRAAPLGVYKVVCFNNHGGCEVFALRDGTGWRWSPRFLILSYIRENLVVVNGIMYE